MKNLFYLVMACLLLSITGCKDKSAPSITSFKINDLEIDLNIPLYSANFNAQLEIEAIVTDDDELLNFITYIDTTGLGGTERLFSRALAGSEDFIQWNLSMRSVDSLSQKYYSGQPVPIYFEASDQQFNTSTIVLSFNVE